MLKTLEKPFLGINLQNFPAEDTPEPPTFWETRTVELLKKLAASTPGYRKRIHLSCFETISYTKFSMAT